MPIARLPLPFVKMSGAGNDFILIDHRKPVIARDDMPEFARLVCRRRFSVGADGLILIENSDQADFKWRFFNGDGSEAEMCGNGARCAARFAYMHGIAPARMRFMTLAGIIEASVADVNVSIRMTAPQQVKLDGKLRLDSETIALHSMDTGVPHVVIFVDDLELVDVGALGGRIRHHPDFMPAGTNVNFVQRLADGTLKMRTYERGVEGETLACGTGATATALVAALVGRASSPVEIITAGGDRLVIIFDLAADKTAHNVFLKGPAYVIYKGELKAEALIENS